MTLWNAPFCLRQSDQTWTYDGSLAMVTEDALDALDWNTAFDDMRNRETGGIGNPDEQRQVGHVWLRAPELAPTGDLTALISETVAAVRDFAARVRSGELKTPEGKAFTDVVHIGIGGSQLGPQVLVDCLAEDENGARQGLQLHFLDNTDPDGIHRTLSRLGERLATTLFLVVSKSGSTPEPLNGLKLSVKALEAAGLPVPGRMVAITMDGSLLHKQATAEGWLTTFPMWDWVGGRFSIMSAVGLLPGELAGVDMASFLAGARTMDMWTRVMDWRDNPAAQMAGTWFVAGHGRGDRNIVVLPYADRLELFSRYLQQLVMESLGKRLDLDGNVVHQGITVYGNKGSTDQHAYVQQLRDGRNDMLVVFLQVLQTTARDVQVEDDITAGDYLQGFLLGTRRALFESGRPSLTLTAPELDAYAMGALIALFERAVSLYGSLIHINAFHQPGVEAGKKAAAAMLKLSLAVREALQGGAKTEAELAEVLGADAMELHYLLERLVLSGRVARDGERVKLA